MGLRQHRFVVLAGSAFLLSWTFVFVAEAQGAAPQGVAENVASPTLEVGAPVEGSLSGGEVRRYRLQMEPNEYTRIVADQLGIDLVISLIAPDGHKLIEVDSPNGNWGVELLEWVAETEGTFVVQLSAADRAALSGCYAIRLEVRRTASKLDLRRVEGAVALAQGSEVLGQSSAEALRGAIDRLHTALVIWRSVGDLYEEGVTLHTIGEISAALGDYQSAIDRYTEALLARRAAMDQAGEGYTLFLRGTVESFVSQVDEAFADYAEALSIEEALGDIRLEAEIHSNLGRLHDFVGQKAEALTEYDRALPLIRATRKQNAEARTLARLASLYESQGEKQKALTCGLQGMRVSRDLGNKEIEAYIGAIVGRVYNELSEPEVALSYLSDALKVIHAKGDPHPEATILLDIGRVHAGLGDFLRAAEYYRQALPLLKTVGDRRSEAGALISLGQAAAAAAETQTALSALKQALSVARSATDPYREADALTALGMVHAALGDRGTAIEELQQALSLRRRVLDRFGEAATAYQIARVEREAGNLEASRSMAEVALEAAESVRAQVTSPDLRASFLGSFRDYYEFYIDVLMEFDARNTTGEFAALALRTSERARARSLLELLVEAGSDIRQGADAALLERDRALRRRLKEKIQQQLELPGAPDADPGAAQLAQEVLALTVQFQELGAEIRSSSPQYAALVQPEPLGLGTIQSLLEPGTVLLEYSLGGQRSFVWAVTPDSWEVYELPARSRLEALARRIHESLTGESGVRSARRFSEASRELSRLVLGPIKKWLASGRLVIVADGALEYVPFSALPVPEQGSGSLGPALVLDHEIISVPSASVLAVLRRDTAGRPEMPRMLAVFADPVFQAVDQRVVSANAGRVEKDATQTSGSFAGTAVGSLSVPRGLLIGGDGQRLARLPFTRREGKAILELVSPDERKEAFDFEANLDNVVSEELSQYRYLHFATHGRLDAVHPELSGLILSLVDRNGRPRDGFLPVADVINLKLPAELVVLSACQTALGKEIRGEGLVGLTRAFMYAGTPRVVASLWRVDDAATAELMKSFYGGMLGPQQLRPAAALRQAQLEVMKQKRWRDPYYWAAFVLLGEWR